MPDARRPLLLLPQDLRGIVPMADANEAVRKAFLDWREHPDLNATRQRMHAPSGVRVSVHPGVTPSDNVVPITYFGSAWGTLGLTRSVAK